MAIIRFLTVFLLIISFAALCTGTALARDNETGAAQSEETDEGIRALYKTLRIQRKLTDIDIEDPAEIPTLFFTLWQYSLLKEARKGGFTNRAPAPYETEQKSDEDRVKGIREISLSGILYHSLDTWTVWLNGERVTPDAIPKEIMDIQVKSDHIDLKWYDAFTNQIFPIRLRTHQRFNLDSRIFLPGIGTGN